MKVHIARAYDMPDDTRSHRVLVDRLWPRGIKKETLKLDAWEKELAPSDELRRWFDHDISKWQGFCRRFKTELNKNTEHVDRLLQEAGKKPILLIYASRDEEHNNAIVLKNFIENYNQ